MLPTIEAVRSSPPSGREIDVLTGGAAALSPHQDARAGDEVEGRGVTGRRRGPAGVQNGNFSAYVTAESVDDDDWRDFSASSQVNRVYLDLAARGEQTEFDRNFTGADNGLREFGTPGAIARSTLVTSLRVAQATHLQGAFLDAVPNF